MENHETELKLAEIASWRSKDAQHQPAWPDSAALERDTAFLRSLPPLVFAGEADKLTEELAAACRGEAFVLMGGDCAESFEESTADLFR